MKKTFWANKNIWALLTGVLFATSYPPFPAWALFFSFVPLWMAWYKSGTLKEVIQTGFIAQFTFTLIGFNWIAHTAVEYGHLPGPVSFLILLAFCCFASLNVVLSGIIVWKTQQRFHFSVGWFFIFTAVVSAAMEWFYPMIFPWNSAYPLLYSGFHTSQLAEFIGFALLSVLVGLANSAFAWAFLHFPQKGWSRPLLIFVAVLFFTESLGTWIQNRLGVEDKNLKVLLVQPNIGNYDKFFAERGNRYQEPVVAKNFEITTEGLAKNPKPDVIVWPETAYPANLDPEYNRDPYQIRLASFARDNHVPVMTGSYSEDPPGSRAKQSYNAFFAVKGDGTILPGYRKQMLLAFGEYFPGSEYFPFLKTIIPEISDFGRGRGPAIFNINGASFSPLICYEGLDTQFVAKTLSLGAQILVNATNDSWFGDSFEPYQHMIMTVARSVEYRRPLIRSTNTGISVVADVRGNLLIKSPQDTEWADTVIVPYFSAPKVTFFYRIAPYLSWIFLLLILVAFLVGVGKYRSDKQRT